MESHYETLKCDENASQSQIQKQYKKLALCTHPDKNKKENTDTAHESFIAVNDAIKVLNDSSRRREYDATLLEKRYETFITNEMLEINDFTYNIEKQLYESECRCGGFYYYDRKQCDDHQVFIQCDSCSLFVNVKLK